MSSAYIIASVTVANPTQYEEYKKWSSAAMQAHGAEVCGASIKPPPPPIRPTVSLSWIS